VRRLIYIVFLACLSGIAFAQEGKIIAKADRVRISPRNSRYFEYKQKPVFLTGARELEMLPRVGNYPYKQAVDRLAEAGCNHWRIEMYLSDSDQEGRRKYPIVSTYKSWWHDPVTGKQEQLDAYKKTADGKFDLNRFNEPFWNRFQDFCELCAEKGIVLTVEIWSTYAIWETSPFNPKNNINYSGSLDVGKHGRDADSEFSFVRTVAALGNRPEILKFQKKFAKKVLDCTWRAGNILYVCGNENGWPREWVEYWADYVHEYGKSKGVRLLYTNIPEHVWHRASSGEVEYLFHPVMEYVLTRDKFDFADMSQLPGGKYPPSKLPKYDTVVDWYKRSKNTPRPIAMSSFHRPWAEGRWNNCSDRMRKMYLSSLKAAGQVITFTSGVEFVDTTRRNDLVSRGWCLAKPPKHYIVYLKEGDESVQVKLKPGSYRWKAFDGQSWTKKEKFDWTGGQRTFKKAGKEDWGLYIEAI